MYRWEVTRAEDSFYLALVDDANEVKHTHPIAFDNARDAQRGADRLNKRDFDA